MLMADLLSLSIPMIINILIHYVKLWDWDLLAFYLSAVKLFEIYLYNKGVN